MDIEIGTEDIIKGHIRWMVDVKDMDIRNETAEFILPLIGNEEHNETSWRVTMEFYEKYVK